MYMYITVYIYICIYAIYDALLVTSNVYHDLHSWGYHSIVFNGCESYCLFILRVMWIN